MNESHNRLIRKFNPGTLQSDGEVIEQFVVRKHEFDIVLDVLRGNVDSPSCQHVLVVAPRGRGKTMLLARVAAELRADDELSRRLLPVRFMEESQEVFNLADFWLETLFHLARESVAHGPEFARELRETHSALTGRWREQALEEHARAAVLEAADRLGRKLVLMVENLQALCKNVDNDFGWKLRGALQSEPQIMLLATATSRFEGLDDVQQPFFELFRIVGLQPLNTGECRRLWQVISGDAVSEREIRPLEILTGGNPRLLVIIAGFAQHRSLRQLMEELVKLIDEHTEYFRSHLEVLGKTERRVYVAVIDLWQASSPGEIAARARMDVRIVSTMLKRLVDRGAVNMEGSGKKRLYAAERLYSIYYKLRRERDESAVVENLIRFMAVFYSEAELAEMSGMLMAEASQSKVIREGIERALAGLPQIGNLFSGMVRPDIDGPSNQAAAIDNGKDERLLREIFVAFDKGAFEKVIETVDRLLASRSAVLYQVSEVLMAWVFLVKAFAHENLGDLEVAITAYDEVIERFSGSDVLELQVGVAKALINKGTVQGQLGDFDAAIAAYDEVISRFGASNTREVQVSVAWALGNKGDTQRELGDFVGAIAAYDEIIKCFGTSNWPEIQGCVARALAHRGIARGVLVNLDAAIAAYDEVIRRFGTSDVPEIQRWVARALVCKAIARTLLGDPDAVIAICDEVIKHFGASKVPEFQIEVAMALVYKGRSQTDLSLAKEALHTCEELERRLGTLTGHDKVVFLWRARWVRAKALLIQGRHQAAMDTFRSAYAEFVPRNETMMIDMSQLVPDLIAAGALEHKLIEILSSDKAKSGALLPLVVALRQRISEEVNAPAEVLEVVADIHKRIKANQGKVMKVPS